MKLKTLLFWPPRRLTTIACARGAAGGRFTYVVDLAFFSSTRRFALVLGHQAEESYSCFSAHASRVVNLEG